MDKNKAFYDERGRRRWQVVLLVALFALGGVAVYQVLWGGVRRSVREKDYSVMRRIFGKPLPESFRLKQAYVERYNPDLIPSPDPGPPDSWPAYYHATVDAADFQNMLNRTAHQQLDLSESALYWDEVKRRLKAKTAEQAFVINTRVSPTYHVSSHVFIAEVGKDSLELYVLTCGVDRPNIWAGEWLRARPNRVNRVKLD